MNTLTLNKATVTPKDKAEIIKSINKHRLENKDSWYKIEVVSEHYTYILKGFNTWVQIGRKHETKTGRKIHDYSSAMGLNVAGFKKYLNDFLNF